MDSAIRSFFLGFIKIHILHHAAREAVYGLWLIEELRRHGYHLSPGTLYPILHALEVNNQITSGQKSVNGKLRKYYRITNKGKKTLREATLKVRELVGEITRT